MSLKKSADQENQVEELDASDKAFEVRLKEIIVRLPEKLLWVLVVVLAFETMQELRSQQISSKVETIFSGSSIIIDAVAIPHVDIVQPNDVPSPISSPQSPELVEMEYDFQVGQKVVINDNSKMQGVISEIAYFNGTEGSKLSFLIVDFPDGSWGGFNPDQLTVLATSSSLSTSQISP